MASTSTPRSLATRRCVVGCCSASSVARTMLWGLVEPRLFVRMSVMPAHSSTARTGPPAITPVPVAAGFNNTRPAPCSPITSWGMVEPVRGSSIIDRLAASTALRTASETSLAFPVAMPTLPLRSRRRPLRPEVHSHPLALSQSKGVAGLPPRLPLQLHSALARAVGDGLHAPMVTITCPVEYYPLDARRLGLLGQQLAGPLGPA